MNKDKFANIGIDDLLNESSSSDEDIDKKFGIKSSKSKTGSSNMY